MIDVQILATGPEFLKRGFRGTKPVIEKLVRDAETEIKIFAYKLGPDMDLWELIEEKLQQENPVDITIILNVNEQTSVVQDKLYDLHKKFGKDGGKFHLIDFEKIEGALLHAKVLVVDRKKVVIGSANFSWGGMVNHYELGVLIEGQPAWDIANLAKIFEQKEVK